MGVLERQPSSAMLHGNLGRESVVKSNVPPVARVIVPLAAVAFVLLNAWAFAETGIPSVAEFFSIPMRSLAEAIPSHRWTTVIAADLVLGWIVFAVVIASLERSRARAFPWIVMLFFIGNLVSAVYLLRNLSAFRGEVE